MTKLIVLLMMVAATAGTALAIPQAPEIDAGSGVTALTLLSGCALVLRGRRKK